MRFGQLASLTLIFSSLGLAGIGGAGCSSSSSPSNAAGPGTTDSDGGPGGDSGTTDTPATAADVPATKLDGDLAACPAPYDAAAPVAGLNKGFKVAGQSREFVLMLPPDSFTGPRPVFIAFNGTGETGPSFASRMQAQDFADAGFIVLAPSSIGNGTVWPVWDGMRTDNDAAENKDLEYFDALLACNAAHFEIDKNRIYIGGHSAGGIFTNYVAQRRSNILAGAIPASGIFSSTSPKPMPTLEKMLVLVTWGGANDKYTGSAGSVSVPEANFVSEASVATKAYAKQKNVGMGDCQGKNLGHVWLPINDWFIKVLLEHPKGFPGGDSGGAGDLVLPPLSSSVVTCSTNVFDYAGAQVTCGASTTSGCQESCQLFADCAVENGTVSAALGPQLADIGFSGTDCGGCVTKCQASSDGADDTTVLACMKSAQATAQCAAGIDGAAPLINAVNSCCAGKLATSKYCASICGTISQSAIAAAYFTACK